MKLQKEKKEKKEKQASPTSGTNKAPCMICIASNINSFTFQELITNIAFGAKAFLEIFRAEILLVLYKEAHIS